MCRLLSAMGLTVLEAFFASQFLYSHARGRVKEVWVDEEEGGDEGPSPEGE